MKTDYERDRPKEPADLQDGKSLKKEGVDQVDSTWQLVVGWDALPPVYRTSLSRRKVWDNC
jgi:hypothetical protein